MVAVQGQVLRWVARRQGVIRWALLDGFFDQLSGSFDDHGVMINFSTVFFPDGEGALGWESHACFLDDL